MIATSEGHPVKGIKSTTTNVYEKCYEHASPAIITTALPQGWVPDTVVMEGMFLINITPWSAHKNIGEYATFLLKQHILPHFRNRTMKFTYSLTILNVRFKVPNFLKDNTETR